MKETKRRASSTVLIIGAMMPEAPASSSREAVCELADRDARDAPACRPRR